jgi:hypothetical protein
MRHGGRVASRQQKTNPNQPHPMTYIEIASRFSFEGVRAVGIKTSNGNGRDFFADGSEFDWQDNNGLEANDPEVLDAARALAATALLAAEANA